MLILIWPVPESRQFPTNLPHPHLTDVTRRMDQEQDIALVPLGNSRAEKASDHKPEEGAFELVEWDEILEDEWCKVEEFK